MRHAEFKQLGQGHRVGTWKRENWNSSGPILEPNFKHNVLKARTTKLKMHLTRKLYVYKGIISYWRKLKQLEIYTIFLEEFLSKVFLYPQGSVESYGSLLPRAVIQFVLRCCSRLVLVLFCFFKHMGKNYPLIERWNYLLNPHLPIPSHRHSRIQTLSTSPLVYYHGLLTDLFMSRLLSN